MIGRSAKGRGPWSRSADFGGDVDNLVRLRMLRGSNKEDPMSKRAFGSIVKRGDAFYIRVRAGSGKRVTRMAGPTRKIASEKLSAVEQLMARGMDFSRAMDEVLGGRGGAPMTVRELAGLYLEKALVYGKGIKESTRDVYADMMRVLLSTAPFASSPLASVTRADVKRWTLSLRQPRQTAKGKKPGISGPTVNRYLALLSTVFRFGVDMGYCEENPTLGIQRADERDAQKFEWLNEKDLAALIGKCDGAIQPLVILAAGTGARFGSLRGLDWRDVDFTRKTIRFRGEGEKSRKGREVPMTTEVEATLKYLHGSRPRPALDGSDPVFTMRGGKGRNIVGKRVTYNMLRVRFPQAVKDSGIPSTREITFHTLRHTWASLAIQKGASLEDVRYVLGHADFAMTLRYAHMAPGMAANAMKVMGGALPRIFSRHARREATAGVPTAVAADRSATDSHGTGGEQAPAVVSA